VEARLNSSTESISDQLAELLTQYLKQNWVKSPLSNKLITASTNMVTELQLDSFQVMEYMLEVEDHFDITVDLESLSNIHTIEDLAGVVAAAHQE
jgi:acyl carrier protein